MAQNLDKITSLETARLYTPGHLLAPFGWAADALAAIVEAEPALLTHLFALDSKRMHLIALAIAHLNEVSPAIGPFLFSGSARAIAEKILGRYPTGIRRALDRLPPSVLAPESYRHLVELLGDLKAAKFLNHARCIDDFSIQTLYRLPASLRTPVIFGAIAGNSGEGFAEGLRFLVSRGAAPSFDALVGELALATQTEQLQVKLRDLVEALPLPTNDLPPIQVGNARRIDDPAAIRALAKSWHNCLAGYVPNINAGICAIYVLENNEVPAACSTRKHGRLGWFLEEVKGPRNVDIEPKRLAAIRSSFNEIGIPHFSVIAAIHRLLHDFEIHDVHLRFIERRHRAIERFLPDPEVLDLAAV